MTFETRLIKISCYYTDLNVICNSFTLNFYIVSILKNRDSDVA
ncbi:hypothetical protein D11S_2337 (plasmid) [Aggregatibacter actinomycetemcomitans D11S-1]|nr:hypothetical protein D11S_2337 [Aggregatibacter actinomycetemcomitans D11S-1]